MRGEKLTGKAVRSEELAQSEMFADMDDATLAETAARMRRRVVPAGVVLITAGEPGDALYLVVRGRLQVFTIDTGGREHIINEAGPGDVVGELALLSDRPRLASVRTVRDCELLELSAADFSAVVERAPAAALHIARTVVTHLERAARPPQARVRSIALVPCGGTGPAVVLELAADLACALGPDTHVIDQRLVETSLGPDPEPAALLDLFDRCERDQFDVVYVADGTDTGWTERCARQADRILLVADARADHRIGDGDGAGPEHTRRDLVVVHPSGTSLPSRTARWLAPREGTIRAHHHVRSRRSDDIARLARLVTERATGLVLGGGGPRGFAHLGVMQALEEAGVPIDMVGGTSIGALMAAGKAFGWDHQTRLAKATRSLAGAKGLFRPTLPVVSLTSGHAITDALRDPAFLGEAAMEDFWLRWFAVSTNLTQACAVVHEHGPAWQAIRASVALPGILPPVYADGDLLVDGGVLNNLPVDVMRQRMDGRVIAVDLEPDVDLRLRTPFPPALSGWRVIGDRLRKNGPAVEVPNAVQVIMRAKQVGGEHAQRAVLTTTPVDLMIRPPMETFGAVNFGAGPRLVETAYRHTLGVLEEAAFAI